MFQQKNPDQSKNIFLPIYFNNQASKEGSEVYMFQKNYDIDKTNLHVFLIFRKQVFL